MSDEPQGGDPQPTEQLKDYSAEIESAPAASDSDQLVENWFDSHIRGSIAGRDTQVWNHLLACKERLKEMLRHR